MHRTPYCNVQYVGGNIIEPIPSLHAHAGAVSLADVFYGAFCTRYRTHRIDGAAYAGHGQEYLYEPPCLAILYGTIGTVTDELVR